MMRHDYFQDSTFSDICSNFPLKPIEDDGSYRAAIEILGRLFALDGARTPAELEYFQILANFAYEYEKNANLIESSHLNPIAPMA
jgi:antitoxin component HigA of HigAB toxin-antitoxin module